ncbi:hypothetical protein HOY82DRAFT_608317 [Tuber indicum]|nr:hypothetical protein HOY82DRAFT_608317 [Tuber indicum]
MAFEDNLQNIVDVNLDPDSNPASQVPIFGSGAQTLYFVICNVYWYTLKSGLLSRIN